MRAWLEAWEPGRTQPAGTIRFSVYGWLKYLCCMLALLASAFGFYRVQPWLSPLSVLVFYLVEVHFLFLFPLLIDGVKYPLWESLRATYRMGLWRALSGVMAIAWLMLRGLFCFSDPFRRWHQGCLAVLIWYPRDVRDRV